MLKIVFLLIRKRFVIAFYFYYFVKTFSLLVYNFVLLFNFCGLVIYNVIVDCYMLFWY